MTKELVQAIQNLLTIIDKRIKKLTGVELHCGSGMGRLGMGTMVLKGPLKLRSQKSLILAVEEKKAMNNLENINILYYE